MCLYVLIFKKSPPPTFLIYVKNFHIIENIRLFSPKYSERGQLHGYAVPVAEDAYLVAMLLY